MSTKYEFDNEAIESFCNNNNVTITLTIEQLDNLGSSGKTPLLVEQISNVADHLCPDEESLSRFLEQKTVEFHPIALSLYVLNDDLWNMMSRKDEHPEKMLPMTTIPWFYWEKEAEGRDNPMGVRKVHDTRNPFNINIDRETLVITGSGGDFAGLLEGRIVDRHKSIRPIFIPGSTGPKKIVPRYDSKFVQIRINTKSMQTTLYPKPMKDLDYFFSEHPRVFYDHGLKINLDGEEVNLRVGNRRETKLRGEVIIFIGKDFKDVSDTDQILMFHVWLSILNRNLFR